MREIEPQDKQNPTRWLSFYAAREQCRLIDEYQNVSNYDLSSHLFALWCGFLFKNEPASKLIQILRMVAFHFQRLQARFFPGSICSTNHRSYVSGQLVGINGLKTHS